MFGSVVVGVNQSVGARDATMLARQLVAPEGKVTLVGVLTKDRYGSAEAAEAYRASGLLGSFDDFVRSWAVTGLEQARDQAWPGNGRPEVGVRAVVSSSVGRCLHEVAEDVRADLLVVGSSQRNLLGRVLVGDDTREALNGAPCAVAIAPTGYADHLALISTIGVGYDRSPESAYALEEARALAGQLGARLSAATAVSVPVSAFGPGPLPLRDAIDALLVQARAHIEDLGGVEPHVGYGAPIDVLAHYSETLDLLVVGSRGYGPLGRLVHGSTSWQLMRSARCALLVLPRAARAPALRDSSASDAEPATGHESTRSAASIEAGLHRGSA
jgi:nucleotide-binding universal stress UspA family protein